MTIASPTSKENAAVKVTRRRKGTDVAPDFINHRVKWRSLLIDSKCGWSIDHASSSEGPESAVTGLANPSCSIISSVLIGVLLLVWVGRRRETFRSQVFWVHGDNERSPHLE